MDCMEFSGEREVRVVVLANIMLEQDVLYLLTRCDTAGRVTQVCWLLEIHFYNSVSLKDLNVH